MANHSLMYVYIYIVHTHKNIVLKPHRKNLNTESKLEHVFYWGRKQVPS